MFLNIVLHFICFWREKLMFHFLEKMIEVWEKLAESFLAHLQVLQKMTSSSKNTFSSEAY